MSTYTTRIVGEQKDTEGNILYIVFETNNHPSFPFTLITFGISPKTFELKMGSKTFHNLPQETQEELINIAKQMLG